jgi:hypothetical protein
MECLQKLPSKIWSMESVNNSLLAKLGWKMTSNHPLLWVNSRRGKYLKNDVSFLNASPNPLFLDLEGAVKE